MNESTKHFCKMACASKSVLRLSDGSLIVLEMAPFVLFFEQFPEITPFDISQNYLIAMDLMVESFGTRSGFKMEELQLSYAWLRLLRDVTMKMGIKVIPSLRNFEEMDEINMTKAMLYGAA